VTSCKTPWDRLQCASLSGDSHFDISDPVPKPIALRVGQGMCDHAGASKVKRVLVCDRLADDGVQILEDAPEVQVDVKLGLGPEALADVLPDYDGVIVRSGTKLTAELIEAATRLRVVCRAGVGVDNVDVGAATRRGIVVMNTPGGNTVSTAEHTIAMLLALSRNISPAHRSLLEGRWLRSEFTGTQVAGKRLGLVGLGRVGAAVARRALALEMEVVGFDPFMSADRLTAEGIQVVDDLDEVLTTGDYISVHTPLSDQTRGLIGTEAFAKMKRGVRLVNCARGGIIDEEALAVALEEGTVAGAALDVFTTEPPGDHPLFRFPNLLATPHLGASTAEAQKNVAMEAARRMVDFLRTGNVTFAVNMPSVDRAEMDALAPYLEAAYRLGLLLAQTQGGRFARVHIRYLGDVAERNTRLVTAGLVAGLLEEFVSEPTNLINAELLAKERGIELVAETRSEPGDFSNLIEAEVQTDKGALSVAATIFAGRYIRLVRMGGYRLDTSPQGTLLVVMHRDAPGLVGHMGTIFGQHKVNIAQMTVGRETAGGTAIGILNLDTAPPEAALDQIRAHADVVSVSCVTLPPDDRRPPWLPE